MKFPPRFTTLIKACVTTPRFSINLNGELVGYFSSNKGLRQGDPLSPYLFAIIMDFLSMVLGKKTSEDLRFSFHWRCLNTKTTHLCFADDLILFCGGSSQAASVLHEALSTFTAHSSLQPNRSKSSVFVVEDNEGLHNFICDLFRFIKGDLLVKYLGVPLITTRLTSDDCKILVERMVALIHNWTSKSLSYAGRLQLIQSVLFSIQVHRSSVFILPKSIIRDVE